MQQVRCPVTHRGVNAVKAMSQQCLAHGPNLLALHAAHKLLLRQLCRQDNTWICACVLLAAGQQHIMVFNQAICDLTSCALVSKPWAIECPPTPCEIGLGMRRPGVCPSAPRRGRACTRKKKSAFCLCVACATMSTPRSTGSTVRRGITARTSGWSCPGRGGSNI